MSDSRQVVLRDVEMGRDAYVLRRPAPSLSTQDDDGRRRANAGTLLHDTQPGAAAQETRTAPQAGIDASTEARSQAGVDAGYQAGFREGFDEGKAAGIQEGREEGRAAGMQEGQIAGREEGRLRALQDSVEKERVLHELQAQRVDQFATWLANIAATLSDQLVGRARDAEEDMIALCHLALCRVFGETVTQRDGVRHAVRQAIDEYCAGGAAAAQSTWLALHVHPDDAARLESDDLLAQGLRRHGVSRVSWIADQAVALGGCVVESAGGRLDARLDTQLRALTALLSRSAGDLTVAAEPGAAR